MDRIACMQSFVRAIEMNSFSAAAREQQTTQPTISKQIAALEKYLGVQLITRSTTNLSLTEEGKKYYQYCQQILETVAEAEASLTGKERATGILRLGCPVLFGQMQIVPRLKAFMKCYPDVKVVLEDYQPTPLPIYGVYRRSRFYPAKITCFIDFLASEFKLDPWVSDYGI